MRKIMIYIKASLRRMSNPVFLMLLLLSFVMWYVAKLSYSYETKINIPVRIDDTYYVVRCGVEGVGYQILFHKLTPRKNLVKINSENIAVAPSVLSPGSYEISSYTLQNIISTQISDLKILSVDAPVEIQFPRRPHD